LKRYTKARKRELTVLAIEMVIGLDYSPAEVGKMLNVSHTNISNWLTKWWFYQKFNNPVVITLKSKV